MYYSCTRETHKLLNPPLLNPPLWTPQSRQWNRSSGLRNVPNQDDRASSRRITTLNQMAFYIYVLLCVCIYLYVCIHISINKDTNNNDSNSKHTYTNTIMIITIIKVVRIVIASAASQPRIKWPDARWTSCGCRLFSLCVSLLLSCLYHLCLYMLFVLLC